MNEGVTNEPPVSYVPTSSPWAQFVRAQLHNIHPHEGFSFDIIGPENYQRLGMVSYNSIIIGINCTKNILGNTKWLAYTF